MDKLRIICDVLEVDPYYLMSGTESNSVSRTDYLTVYKEDEEYDFLVEFRNLDKTGRDRLKGYIQALRESKQN